MGCHHVDVANIEPTPEHPCNQRSIADATGLSVLAAAVYELAPGEPLATTYHYHEEREELFLVLSGVLHVETPDTEYEIPAGDVFVVEPGQPIRPYNPADTETTVRVFGVGAPRYDIGLPYDPT